jgi:cytochrome c-type biogenesis protein
MITELIALFGAGIASIVAPCSLVLVPAYAGMLTSQAPDAPRPTSLVVATVLFSVGFTAVFVALGTTTALLGASIGATRQALAVGGGAVLIVFGLAKLTSRVAPLSREYRLLSQIPAVHHTVRPLVFGVGFGAAWTPCVGPLLGTALTLAAQSQHAGRAALLLTAYGAGTGTAFLIATLTVVASPRLHTLLRRASRRVDRITGAILLPAGIALTTGLYTTLTGWAQHLTPNIRGL